MFTAEPPITPSFAEVGDETLRKFGVLRGSAVNARARLLPASIWATRPDACGIGMGGVREIRRARAYARGTDGVQLGRFARRL